METILVALIIKMCEGDKNMYYVQDEPQDCHHYYINCAVGKGGEVTEQTLDRCENGKQKAKVTNK